MNLLCLIPLLCSTAAPAPPPEEDKPCVFEDHGFGQYAPWQDIKGIGKILMPQSGGLDDKGRFDLIVHFHGGDGIRKHLALIEQNAFVLDITLGAGSRAYEKPFQGKPERFQQVLAKVEQEVASARGLPKAKINRLVLSGWSAGYGAIRALLRQPIRSRVDAVVLLDGLHADYEENQPGVPRAEQMQPFIDYAKRAASNKGFMFISHSSIVPPGYASTTETMHYLTKKLGGTIVPTKIEETKALTRIEEASQGGYLMRGYMGEGKQNHCDQLALINPAWQSLRQRWAAAQLPASNQKIAKNSTPAKRQQH